MYTPDPRKGVGRDQKIQELGPAPLRWGVE